MDDLKLEDEKIQSDFNGFEDDPFNCDVSMINSQSFESSKKTKKEQREKKENKEKKEEKEEEVQKLEKEKPIKSSSTKE